MKEQETFGRSAFTPRKVDRLADIAISEISSSAAHTAFVDSDHHLWTCGLGEDGQLGHGSMDSLGEPKRINNIPPILSVVCGNRHTLALTVHGDIYAFGCNKHGQLGTASDDKNPFPLAIPTLQQSGQTIVSVSAGDDFSAAASVDGSVYTWGSASLGRLGHAPDSSSVSGPISFLLGGATSERTPRKLQGLPARAASVHCGKHHTLALTSSGSAFAWGAGRHFQLGTGREEDCPTPVESLASLGREEVVQVSAGGMHSLIRCRSGSVYAVGMNEFGCLGLGYAHADTRSAAEPVRVHGVRDAIDVAAGWNVSAAIVGPRGEDGCGDVVTWGCGGAGALGVGDPVDHWEPVATGVRARRVVVGSAGAHVLAVA